tara:strand:- start:180 stop:326 length:147 start_codon:yes stop_codon:yes gene_type:complete
MIDNICGNRNRKSVAYRGDIDIPAVIDDTIPSNSSASSIHRNPNEIFK